MRRECDSSIICAFLVLASDDGLACGVHVIAVCLQRSCGTRFADAHGSGHSQHPIHVRQWWHYHGSTFRHQPDTPGLYAPAAGSQNTTAVSVYRTVSILRIFQLELAMAKPTKQRETTKQREPPDEQPPEGKLLTSAIFTRTWPCAVAHECCADSPSNTPKRAVLASAILQSNILPSPGAQGSPATRQRTQVRVLALQPRGLACRCLRSGAPGVGQRGRGQGFRFFAKFTRPLAN